MPILEGREIVGRIFESKSESLLHQESSWLANAIAAFSYIFFSGFNLGFKFLFQLQAVFEEVFELVAKLLLFLMGKIPNGGLDLLQRLHSR